MKRQYIIYVVLLCMAVALLFMGIGYRSSSSAVLDLKAGLEAIYGEEYTETGAGEIKESMVFVIEPRSFFFTNWSFRHFLGIPYKYNCKVVFTNYDHEGKVTQIRTITYLGVDPMGEENSTSRAYLVPDSMNIDDGG